MQERDRVRTTQIFKASNMRHRTEETKKEIIQDFQWVTSTPFQPPDSRGMTKILPENSISTHRNKATSIFIKLRSHYTTVRSVCSRQNQTFISEREHPWVLRGLTLLPFFTPSFLPSPLFLHSPPFSSFPYGFAPIQCSADTRRQRVGGEEMEGLVVRGKKEEDAATQETKKYGTAI